MSNPNSSSLRNKRILIAVTGSIAAYKAAMLVRLLVSEGAEVKVVMTAAAKDFISPLTLATLSRNPVLIDGFDPENGAWNSHISLGEWADYYIVAPATANTIAKMRAGIADNLVTCTYLSARCPVAIAPAMDVDMYQHVATGENIAALQSRAVAVVEPGEGFLASGLIGKGRMCEPTEIVEFLRDAFTSKTLAGKRVMITAGATVEPIDPVRFISNHSSGKMGFALADACARRGALVTLVAGNVTATLQSRKVHTIKALTAVDMFEAASANFEGSDITIFCAAVADFTPATVAENKIKNKEGLTVELVATQDIAATLGARKRLDQISVCFALETENEEQNALRKLESKNADVLILNSLNDAGAGFSVDTNKVTIFQKNSPSVKLPLMDKCELADYIANLLN